jgi:hypothetical protein
MTSLFRHGNQHHQQHSVPGPGREIAVKEGEEEEKTAPCADGLHGLIFVSYSEEESLSNLQSEDCF